MNLPRLGLLATAVLLASCAATGDRDTIADLRHVKLDLADEQIEGGIEKAMAGYQKFLEQTPDSTLAPEAIRRLADLKIEREYGQHERSGAARAAVTAMPVAAVAAPLPPQVAGAVAAPVLGATATRRDQESQKDFEQRTTAAAALPASGEEGVDLHNAGALEAIALYRQLLEKYPHYERADQVLYQMSRAHEELGQVDEAMAVMNRIASDYPKSRYADEIQFRRGEYFFMRKKFLDAERAYQAIVKTGESSFYYELARYKLGWTFYKQDMHEEALDNFVALLDLKGRQGFDLETAKDEFERKRVEDTYRVISLSFSALGGADAVVAYFGRLGQRAYEVNIYRNLGEHYLEKRRYADAATTYRAFVKRNPWHKVAPHFDMRVIEIYKEGGFPQLVIEANKDFATNYGLKSAYWQHFKVDAYPEVLGYLKTNLKELANYYHALYQEKRLEKERPENFREASHWYREFLDSFPKDSESPVMNYQLADLLLENRDFAAAAAAYERTAYDYPAHDKAAAAGYAAVYAYREQLGANHQYAQEDVRRAVIRSSLRFAETFPQHEKAALVMGAALEDIYAMRDYEFAVATGRKLLAAFPAAEPAQRRSAWLVVAHSAFELQRFAEAEEGYTNVLALTAPADATRAALTENLAASIYKQGEQANAAADFTAAAAHFLRVGQAAPTAKIRPTADYDAATALMQLKDWERAAEVLLAFRGSYPGHAQQPEVTKKIAHVYHEAGKLALAAAEYERIEAESKDEAIRREALEFAAALYLKAESPDHALRVYRRYLAIFPHPLEPALENRQRIADILKARNDRDGYLKELRQIVDADAAAGRERTERTRYLAATGALVLTEPVFEQFAGIALTQPFDKSLKKKKAAMKTANEAFGKLLAYEVGDVTAAATYYIAEAYFNFSEALKKSERPKDLDELEAEQYEEALDEQSYPFEEKAIQIHEKNLNFVTLGVYNPWIDRSLARLATLMPGRYARFEESSGFIESMVNVSYQALTNPPPPVPEPAVSGTGGAAGTDAAAPDGSLPASPPAEVAMPAQGGS